jgi:hypothetical protein
MNTNKMIAFFKSKVAADTSMDPKVKERMSDIIDLIDKEGLNLYAAVVEKTGPKFALVLLESALQHGLAITPMGDDFATGDLGIPDFADSVDSAFADAVRAG